MRRACVFILILSVGFAIAEDAGTKANENYMLNLIRLINTAELDYQHARGHFADYEELSKSDSLRTAAQRLSGTFSRASVAIDPDSPLRKHYNLVLVSKGDKYVVVVNESNDEPCKTSFVSDNKGIILRAVPVGCE